MRIFTIFCMLFSFLVASDAKSLPKNSYVLSNIAFKQVSINGVKKDLLLDIYLPSIETKNAPMIVWVYGGAWKKGNKESFVSRNNRLLNVLLDRGYAVMAMQYRLSGEAKFPAQIQDINDAVEFVWQNHTKFGINPDKIAMAGRSAGGHLSSLASTSNSYAVKDFITLSDKPSFKIGALIAYFAPLDLYELEISKKRENSNNSSEALLLGTAPSKDIDLAKKSSPISYIRADTPPTILLHSTNDRNVPHAQKRAV